MLSKPSIRELIDQTTLNDRDLAVQAGVSEGTFRKLKHGEYVKRKTVWKVINTLNYLLDTSYTIQDIDGINC